MIRLLVFVLFAAGDCLLRIAVAGLFHWLLEHERHEESASDKSEVARPMLKRSIILYKWPFPKRSLAQLPEDGLGVCLVRILNKGALLRKEFVRCAVARKAL